MGFVETELGSTIVSLDRSSPGVTTSVGDAGEEDSEENREVSTSRLEGGRRLGGATGGGSNEAEGNWERVLRVSLKSDKASSLRDSSEESELDSTVLGSLEEEEVSATTPGTENEFVNYYQGF